MKKHEEKGWEWHVTLRTIPVTKILIQQKNTKTQLMMIPSASRTELLLDIEGKGARISRHIAFFWCNEISDKLGRSQIW